MRIASVSKAFSGAVALAMVDQGLLSHDTSASCARPPPDVATDDPAPAPRHTPRHAGLHAKPGFAGAFSDSPAVAPRRARCWAMRRASPAQMCRAPPTSHEPRKHRGRAHRRGGDGRRLRAGLRAKVTTPLGLGRTQMPKGTLIPDPLIHATCGTRGSPGATAEWSPLDSGVAWGGWGGPRAASSTAPAGLPGSSVAT